MHRLVDFVGQAGTIAEVLAERAVRTPALGAFTFLRDGEGEAATLTYADLDRAARAVGGMLRGRVQAGQRVLLVHPPGPEFVAALFGCFYAGAIAVPAYPPDPAQLGRTLPRLEAIARDCGAALACSTGQVCAIAQALVRGAPAGGEAPTLAGLDWLATDPGGGAEPGSTCFKGHVSKFSDETGLDGPRCAADEVALLQYTSGSTGDPKGVRVSHANILANLALIHEGVQQGPDSLAVLWLPPYHDMGLVNTLYAVAVGFPCVALAPWQFLRRPGRWLEAIARFRATYSGGPSFAYDLAARRASRDAERLDLRSWRVAFNGAEPVRHEVLQRFTRAFAAAGFSPRAHYPCYGLAEATVAVTGGEPFAGPRVRWLSRAGLQAGRAEEVGEEAPEAVAVVGCGSTKRGHVVRIVDPETRRVCADDRVGEIWVAGPSVAGGYHGRGDARGEVFGARLAEDDGRVYLRTGDLGFSRAGELFVTGRRKEVIIVHGKNHHPADLERTAESAAPLLRPGCAAAFAIDEPPALVVVAELVRGSDATAIEESEGAAIRAAIAAAIADAHGVAVREVVLVAAGTVPRTTSGKVQRLLCRDLYARGQLAPDEAEGGAR